MAKWKNEPVFLYPPQHYEGGGEGGGGVLFSPDNYKMLNKNELIMIKSALKKMLLIFIPIKKMIVEIFLGAFFKLF
jgi:hypothetical protein